MFVDAGGISPICNDQCGVITEMYYVMYCLHVRHLSVYKHDSLFGSKSDKTVQGVEWGHANNPLQSG